MLLVHTDCNKHTLSKSLESLIWVPIWHQHRCFHPGSREVGHALRGETQIWPLATFPLLLIRSENLDSGALGPGVVCLGPHSWD